MNRRFLRSLHEEHLEEISMLYERRLGMLDDPEIDVEDLLNLEDRMEAHLDALVVGARAAVELCVERAAEGDPGERFGAIAALCRHGRDDLVEAVLPSFEPSEGDEDDRAEEPTPASALTDALRFEAPGGWVPAFERWLASPWLGVRAAVAVAAGWRGLPLGPAIVAATEHGDPGTRIEPLLWALGRLRERTAVSLLSSRAQRIDAPEAAAATLALLRFGDPSVIASVVRLTAVHPWACSLLAISGGSAHSGSVLRDRLARADVVAEEIVAAGLLGDVGALPRLIECLENGLYPEAAAQALYLITGAPVLETVVVEPEEPEFLANGEPDPRSREEIVRLSQDPGLWHAWWQGHHAAFQRGRRHRLGQLASATVIGNTLHRFVLQRFVRQLAAEEIGLRYQPRQDLDVDMRVRSQYAALASLQQSDAAVGAWVFARAPVR